MKDIHTADAQLIHLFRRISMPAARIALFIIFFWFGMLKLIGLSPAGPMVQDLANTLIPFIPFGTFYICFALLECIIGILFIIPGLERIVIPLLFLQMISTFMPLIFLPSMTWSVPLVPTLEGQYIIKNLVIIALAFGIAAHLHPLPRKI